MGLTEESVGARLGDRLAVHFDLLGPVLRAAAVGVGALPGLYRQLERECEYLTSDDAVDEAITVNKYTFTAEDAFQLTTHPKSLPSPAPHPNA